MSKSLPWGQFYWADYAGDPNLKICSLAAQGLWMRMLCIAADNEGLVALGGVALENSQLAVLCGTTVDEVENLVAELDRKGVFSRDRNGTIFSRRMKNDEKKRQIARKNGKLGGNPTLSKKREKSASDNLKDKPEDKTPLKPQRLETRDQTLPLDKSNGPMAGNLFQDDDRNNLPDEPPANDPASPDFDPVKALFDDGVRILGNTGTAAKSARSLIGRWRKSFGDDVVALAFAAAEGQGISQPVEWIPKFCANRAKQPGSSGLVAGSTGDPFMDAMMREKAERDALKSRKEGNPK